MKNNSEITALLSDDFSGHFCANDKCIEYETSPL